MKQLIFSLLGLSIFISVQPAYAACSPGGTTGDDTVICTGIINSYQYFYGGSDTVRLNGVSARTSHNVYWLDEALGGNPATDGNDTFEANASEFYWVFGFGGDDSFHIVNSQFNNAYGDTNPMYGFENRGNDTFLIENSTSYGYILGGNDNDTITIIDSNVSNVASGYSDIYAGVDYTPHDGNDTILLDHVNFTAPLYWDATSVEGVVEGGRGDDTITFQHGGEAYYVYGGHGNDIIEVFDNEQFHACTTSSQITDRCGIYGDESYASELNASATPILHGDDRIILHDGNVSGILIQGGDGSDLVTIETPVLLAGTELNGGDDISAADTFIDRIELIQWAGELNGSQFHNWEQVRLRDDSNVTLQDTNISVGADPGLDPSSGLPYGLIIDGGSTLNLYHDFNIDGNLRNDATVNLQDGNASGTVLSIEGDYNASSGTLNLDTVLNDASPSISDQLVVTGDTSGSTVIDIANIGGTGGQTPTTDNSGILLVEVQGSSNGIFSLSGPIQTANYWYHLIKGSNGNWYLQSEPKTYILDINKTLAGNDDEDGSGTVSLGDTLHYTNTATNTGNTTLHHVQLTDALLSPGTTTCATLASGDDCTLVGTYTITQNDVDAGERNNTATATADETPEVNATVQVPIPQSPELSVRKTVDQTNISQPTVLHYHIEVHNTGNVSLIHIVLHDVQPDGSQGQPVYLSGDDNANNKLDVGETWIYGENYTVTQEEIDRGDELKNTLYVQTTDQAVEAQTVARTEVKCWCKDIDADRVDLKTLLYFFPIALWLFSLMVLRRDSEEASK